MRYVRQYHEVSLPLLPLASLADRFHAEHNRLYGYSLEEEGTPLELINLRVRAVGVTEKPTFRDEERSGADPGFARKGEREAWVPEERAMRPVPVYDGHALRFGNRIAGPAVVEQRNTTLFMSADYDAAVDSMGSFVVYHRDRREALPESVREVLR
jgi:N-methylhydantoinase A